MVLAVVVVVVVVAPGVALLGVEAGADTLVK